MINEVYVNGEQVKSVTYTTSGRLKRLINLSDGSIINGTPRISIKCTDCGKIATRTYDKSLVEGDKKYLCQSCSVRGERNGFYGKTHTDETKELISLNRPDMSGENNPMYGRSWVDALRDKCSSDKEFQRKFAETSKRRSNSASGENNGFYGKTHSPAAIEAIIKANEEYRNNLTDEELSDLSKTLSIGQRRAKERDPVKYSNQKRKAARASHISQFENWNPNRLESVVKDWLDEHNIDYEFSVILGFKQFDFGIRSKRILIEVDGDYWHGNPDYFNEDGSNGKRKLNNIQRGKMKSDKLKNKWATDHNFKLIRIWESDINDGTFTQTLRKLLCD